MKKKTPFWLLWIGGFVGLLLMYLLRVLGKNFGLAGLSVAMAVIALTLLVVIMRYGFRAMEDDPKEKD